MTRYNKSNVVFVFWSGLRGEHPAPVAICTG